jgi:hypothetical protein
MVILRSEKIPSNLYGFRSSVLGISADRILTIAIFSLVAFIISRYYIPISLVVLACGFILALSSRNGRQPLLYYISAFSWKVSGKNIIVETGFEVSERSFTVISEGKRKAVILSITSEEIYDLNEQDSFNVAGQINNLLQSDLEIKLAIISVPAEKLKVDSFEKDTDEFQYYTMVNDALGSTMFHRVYMILANSGPSSSVSPTDEKIKAVIGFLQSAGCSVRTKVSREEVSDLFYSLT